MIDLEPDVEAVRSINKALLLERSTLKDELMTILEELTFVYGKLSQKHISPFEQENLKMLVRSILDRKV